MRLSPAGFVVLAVLGVLMPIASFLLWSTPFSHPALQLHWLMMPILALPLALHARSHLYADLSFYLFAYVFFGLAVNAQLLVGGFPWGGDYGIWDVLRGDLIVLAGVAAYFGGSEFARRRTPILAKQEIPRKQFLLLIAVASALFAFTLPLTGGFEVMFLPRNEGYEVMTSREGGDVLALMQLAVAGSRVPVIVLSVAAMVMALFNGRYKFIAFVLVLANIVINNPVSTARFLVGTWAIAYFLILGMRFFPRRLAAIYAISVPLMFVFIFPIADYFRASFEGGYDSLDLIMIFPIKPDFDAFQLLMDGAKYVEQEGVTAGQQFLGALGFWFPRAMWPTKADPTGIMLGQWSGKAFWNLSAPLWIEFYLDGWWIFLVAGMFTYGYWCRRLQNGLSYYSTPGTVLTFLLAGYQMILLRGSLMSALSFLAPVALCVIVLARRKKSVRVSEFGRPRPY